MEKPTKTDRKQNQQCKHIILHVHIIHNQSMPMAMTVQQTEHVINTVADIPETKNIRKNIFIVKLAKKIKISSIGPKNNILIKKKSVFVSSDGSVFMHTGKSLLLTNINDFPLLFPPQIMVQQSNTNCIAYRSTRSNNKQEAVTTAYIRGFNIFAKFCCR